ncbi:MAG: cytochrome P450 [Thermomicrobiales bacterium]|nr:cytochrome P450 [Thermomicrobiales bacterium]
MHRSIQPSSDWDPFAAAGGVDPRDVYDDMRERCPVAYSDALQWSVFRHDDVMRILADHETFSNQVSRFLSVPNGMDPPEHTVYRGVIVPYFSKERVQAFEPVGRAIVVEHVDRVTARGQIDLISDFALDVSVRMHCAFLGWPEHLHQRLAEWTLRSRDAARFRDQSALAAVSHEFRALVDEMLHERRASHASPEDDVTRLLMSETVFSRPLDDEEITSILRNWTVGEIGTMSAAIGIVVHFLAEHPDLQEHLRAEPSLLSPAIDETLRLHGPLVTNRRIATRRVEIGGRTIEAGERLSLNWVAANRDERAFENATTFALDRDPSRNLLYGAGIHVCPGAPLARLELRLVLEELLQRTSGIELDPAGQPVMASYPASGFATLPVRMMASC